jgi:hypothetical protein
MLLIAEIDQGIEAIDRFDDDIASFATVAAIRAAEFDVFLAPEAHGAGTAVAAPDVDFGLVEKFHDLGLRLVASFWLKTLARGTKKEGEWFAIPLLRVIPRKGMGQGILAPRRHRNKGAALFLTAERHFAFNSGEDRVVPSHTDVGAGVILGTPLAHKNIAGDNDLAAELLDAEPPARAIAAVAGAAACFLMCHGTFSSIRTKRAYFFLRAVVFRFAVLRFAGALRVAAFLTVDFFFTVFLAALRFTAM